MNVIIIHPWDPLGDKLGGAETFLKNVIKYSPSDVSIRLVGISSTHKNYVMGEWNDVNFGSKKVKFMPLLFEKDENQKKLIPLSLRFAIALRMCNVDYTDSIILFNRFEPVIFFRKILSPKVCIIHNDIEKQIMSKGSEVFWCKIPQLYFMVERFLFSRFEKIYVVDEASFVFYKRKYYYLKDRFIYIKTIVDNEIFSLKNAKSNLRSDLNLPDLASVVLFVGRLQKQKDPMKVIEVFEHLKNKNENALLVMIGAGNMENSILRCIKASRYRDSIIHFSSMPQKELAKYYKTADVCLLVSNFEGMPITVLESLASGTPVITKHVGDVARVVRNNVSGMVVELDSPESISDSVSKFLKKLDDATPELCLNAVQDYFPQNVLPFFFKSLNSLFC